MKVVKPGATSLYPVPAVLVTCGVVKPNIITLAWVGTVCSDPPSVGIALRRERYSYSLIVEDGEFVVNLPRTEQVGVVDFCGQTSGRSADKWAVCGLTPAPSSKVRVPLIAECPIALECRVLHRFALGSHDLFVGEVVAIQADEKVLNSQGGLDYERAQLLAYAGGSYWRLGKRLGRHGDWKKGPGHIG